MDIEGTEVSALKGATKTMTTLRKIIVEIHGNYFEAVEQLLHANGLYTEIISKNMTYIVGSKPHREKWATRIRLNHLLIVFLFIIDQYLSRKGFSNLRIGLVLGSLKSFTNSSLNQSF
jgi:hypothetical protein